MSFGEPEEVHGEERFHFNSLSGLINDVAWQDPKKNMNRYCPKKEGAGLFTHQKCVDPQYVLHRYRRPRGRRQRPAVQGHSAVSARPTPLGFSRDNVVRCSRCMITSCSMGLGKLLLVAVVIFAVTMVFCAPFTYLEPTALRASQAANHLKMALLAAAFTLASLLCLIGFFWLVCRHCPSPLATVDDLVALNCARHC
jgi:hypothetical protein